MESKPLGVRTLLPRPAVLFSLLKLPCSLGRGLLRGLLALPIHSTSNCSLMPHAPKLLQFFTLSPSTARERMWRFPGADGGTHWSQEPGALAGKSVRKT